MASVENLSDAELRQKLIEHGYPVGPVTQTTRKTFEKKLVQLMSQNGKSGKDSASVKQSRNLSRFSSAEEDSDDGYVSHNKRKSMPPPASSVVKRKSLGRSARAAEAAREAASKSLANEVDTSAQPPPDLSSSLPAQGSGKSSRSRYSVGGNDVTRKTPSKALNNSNSRPGRPSRKSIATSAPSRTSKNVDAFDSDSDVPFSLSNRSSNFWTSTQRTDYDHDDDDDDEEDGQAEDDVDMPESSKPITTLRELSNVSNRFLPGSEPLGTTSELKPSELLYQHRLGIGRENPFEIEENPTPYLSAFAHRLSKLKAASLSSSNAGHSSLLDDVKESDASDSSFQSESPNGNCYTKRSPPARTRTKLGRVDPSKYRPVTDTNSLWKNSHVLSCIILGGFLLFALALGVVYVNVTTKALSPLKEKLEAGNTYKICKDTAANDVPKVNCVKEEHVKPAKNLFDMVFRILQSQVVKSKCGPPLEDGTYIKPHLTEKELLEKVTNSNLSVWDVEDDLANLVVLLELNPHWGITVLDSSDSVVRQSNKASLIVTSPSLPLSCIIRNRAYDAISFLCFIAAGCVVGYAIWQGSAWWLKQREKNRREVYHYVERILEVLASHQQSLRPGDDPYLAINHVRDQLIAPYDRQRLKSVWDAAVNFIEDKESRVRVEIQPVNGEDYKVWRWLTPSSNPGTPITGSTLGSPLGGRRKVWQGQAFETMEGSVNALPVSPTPCLKVRHMFDANAETGDNWPQQVKDAILEKCEGVKIVHIEVDRSSKEGCVYIKCASNEDAGKAYKELHGSWFDSQLVTVKYIRLERYHERFPTSIRSVRPLRRLY